MTDQSARLKEYENHQNRLKKTVSQYFEYKKDQSNQYINYDLLKENK